MDTYAQFTEQNRDILKSLPPPLVALEYYKGGDLYMFDALRSGRRQPERRPPCKCARPPWLPARMSPQRSSPGHAAQAGRHAEGRVAPASLRALGGR